MMKALSRAWSNFRAPATRQQKASATLPAVNRNGNVRPEYVAPTFAAIASEYTRNTVVQAAVTKLASAAAAVPPLVYQQRGRRREEIESGPLVDLLEQANPQQSGVDFRRDAIAFYLLSGNAYIERVGPGEDSLGPPRELYTHRPDLVSVLPGDIVNPIAGYKYQVNGTEHVWSAERIRHWKSFNPLSEWYGMSALNPAARSIQLRNSAIEWNVSRIRNGCRPDLLISVDEPLTEEQYARMQRSIDENYSGGPNAGKPLLVEGGKATVTPMSTSPVDMDWLATINLSATEIAMSIGVPPEMLGIHQGAARRTYAESRKSFYHETIFPLLDKFYGELTAFLAPHFGQDLLITYDPDEVAAVWGDRNALWERYDRAFTGGLVTINEARHAIGYSPYARGDSNADRIYIPATSIPLESHSSFERPPSAAAAKRLEEIRKKWGVSRHSRYKPPSAGKS